jgi:hypothetical protein
LLINADRILPGSIAPQGFEAVAWKTGKIGEAERCIEYLQPLPALSVKTLERPHELALGEKLCALVPEAQNH